MYDWQPLYLEEPFKEFVRVAASSKGVAVQCSLYRWFRDPLKEQRNRFMDRDPLSYHEIKTKDFKILQTLKACSVVMQFVSLHVNISKAIESGRFGCLGEERIVLISATDRSALQKYYELWLSGPRDPEPGIFLRAAVESQQYQEAVKHWQYEAQVNWLHFKYKQVVRNGALHKEDLVPGGRSSIWYFNKRWDAREGFLPRFYVSQNAKWEGLFNEEHSFVQKALGKLTRLEPVVMFRLWEKKCYEDYQ